MGEDWPLWPGAGASDEAGADLARAYARTFREADGARVLAHLRALTIERRVPPDAGEALLRHVEGQRHLVALIESLVVRGRAPR